MKIREGRRRVTEDGSQKSEVRCLIFDIRCLMPVVNECLRAIVRCGAPFRELPYISRILGQKSVNL